MHTALKFCAAAAIAIGTVAFHATPAIAGKQVPYNVKARAVMSGDLGACTSAAFGNARAEAVRLAISDLAGSFDPLHHEGLVPRADEFISRGGIRSKRDLGNGFCEVSAGLRIDRTVLQAALRADRGGTRAIATVVRFRIEGKYVGPSGMNPLMPTTALNAAMNRNGCRTFALVEHHDRFASRLRALNQLIVDDNGIAETTYNTISFAEALFQLIDEIRQNLMATVGSSKKADDFDIIIVGDVNVVPEGDDPLGSGRIARAEATLELRAIHSDITAPVFPVSVRITAPTDGEAMRIAAQQSMELIAKDIERSLSLCAG